MEYGIVNVAAAPVRCKPDHRREMINQLLFGETVKVLKKKGDLWVKICSLHDNYTGWMTNTMLQQTDAINANMKPVYTTAEIVAEINTNKGKIVIPVGSSLPFYKEGNGKIGNEDYSYTGMVNNRFENFATVDSIKQLTNAWLNAPYLWGGRTLLGVDCSGFVQVIYKQLGIDLPRDARQQAKRGKKITFFCDVQCGDLAFFGNKKAITHVGILLGDGTVIHASGRVRVDVIDKKGITSDGVFSRQYLLKCIRRYW
jgi:gamma-D-glutamyl-L-lysine dipeptidyl-peptidase